MFKELFAELYVTIFNYFFSCSFRSNTDILKRAMRYPIPDKFKQSMPNRGDDTPKVWIVIE